MMSRSATKFAQALCAAQRTQLCALDRTTLAAGHTALRRYSGDHGDNGMPARLRAPFPILGLFRFVPEKQACVVERFGRFSRLLSAGLNITIPIVESVAYTHSLKELTLLVNTQQAITKDNVTIHINGVLYVRVVDAFKASYGVDEPLYAVMQLAQTSMRSELGKMTLDSTFEERDALNVKIVNVINHAARTWGIECLRYEIKDIVPPPGIVEAMELQAEAERRKRAQVLESEGVRQAQINESEARRESAINNAIGEAQTISRRAEATAQGIRMVADAITDRGGADAVSMTVAQQYVEAFGNIAQKGNTIVVPADAGNVAGMVTQATAIFQEMSHRRRQSGMGASDAASSIGFSGERSGEADEEAPPAGATGSGRESLLSAAAKERRTAARNGPAPAPPLFSLQGGK